MLEFFIIINVLWFFPNSNLVLITSEFKIFYINRYWTRYYFSCRLGWPLIRGFPLRFTIVFIVNSICRRYKADKRKYLHNSFDRKYFKFIVFQIIYMYIIFETYRTHCCWTPCDNRLKQSKVSLQSTGSVEIGMDKFFSKTKINVF